MYSSSMSLSIYVYMYIYSYMSLENYVSMTPVRAPEMRIETKNKDVHMMSYPLLVAVLLKGAGNVILANEGWKQIFGVQSS